MSLIYRFSYKSLGFKTKIDGADTSQFDLQQLITTLNRYKCQC